MTTFAMAGSNDEIFKEKSPLPLKFSPEQSLIVIASSFHFPVSIT